MAQYEVIIKGDGVEVKRQVSSEILRHITRVLLMAEEEADQHTSTNTETRE